MSKLNWWKVSCAMSLLCAATAIDVSAQTFTTLHSFDGTDGAFPYAGVVQATDGNLYGTTGYDGANGGGTVFKITPNGKLVTLYSFCSQIGCTDGTNPYATLVQATDGNLYGTTVYGGASDRGTVFRITSAGTLTTLYSFCLQTGCPDGYYPYAGLVQASDGDLYGTTAYGGANGDACYFEGCGTVFKITPSGSLTTLYSFCPQEGCTDGATPYAALVQGTDGDLFGTTYQGGGNGFFYGTVFKITTSGRLTALYSFCPQGVCTDGANPRAGLVQATDGSFYGTTPGGGVYGWGTVFKVTPRGRLTTLYSFCAQSDCADGLSPHGGLVQGTNGDLYGTTRLGGSDVVCSFGCGTAFRITPIGTLTTLYSFCSQIDCPDGQMPIAGLALDTNGELYGTTEYGGTNDTCSGSCGTVFSVSAGLGPFVETRPTTGKVGKPVIILGTNLTGTTSVAFNGSPAAFRVVSPSAISTSVPAGATTGAVQVVTPSGTLSSNVPFRVAP